MCYILLFLLVHCQPRKKKNHKIDSQRSITSTPAAFISTATTDNSESTSGSSEVVNDEVINNHGHVSPRIPPLTRTEHAEIVSDDYLNQVGNQRIIMKFNSDHFIGGNEPSFPNKNKDFNSDLDIASGMNKSSDKRERAESERENWRTGMMNKPQLTTSEVDSSPTINSSAGKNSVSLKYLIDEGTSEPSVIALEGAEISILNSELSMTFASRTLPNPLSSSQEDALLAEVRSTSSMLPAERQSSEHMDISFQNADMDSAQEGNRLINQPVKKKRGRPFKIRQKQTLTLAIPPLVTSTSNGKARIIPCSVNIEHGGYSLSEVRSSSVITKPEMQLPRQNESSPYNAHMDSPKEDNFVIDQTVKRKRGRPFKIRPSQTPILRGVLPPETSINEVETGKMSSSGNSEHRDDLFSDVRSTSGMTAPKVQFLPQNNAPLSEPLIDSAHKDNLVIDQLVKKKRGRPFKTANKEEALAVSRSSSKVIRLENNPADDDVSPNCRSGED